MKYCNCCGKKMFSFRMPIINLVIETRYSNCRICLKLANQGYSVVEIWEMVGTKEKKELAKRARNSGLK